MASKKPSCPLDEVFSLLPCPCYSIIAAKGTADARVAGFFTSILRRSASLAPSATEVPTVLIETKEQ